MSDICFVVAPQNKDTILDRIAHEVGKSFKEPEYCYTSLVPKADRYFVTHYSLLPSVMQQVNPGITPVISFFTHDKGGILRYVDLFNLCHSVIAESAEGADLLRSIGVNPNLVHFVPEGGDNLAFQPHARKSDGAILVCGTNYADGRKNPNLVTHVASLIGYDKFLFLGKNWGLEKSYDPPYYDYPKEYEKCSVYLSCSKLEGGGPNSLIEAMHANLVPVVSDTGNAREYIVDGYNGYIFGKDATPEQVAGLIEKAYLLDPSKTVPYNDIWQTVRSFTWQAYSLNMYEIIMNDYSVTNSQELLDDTSI